MGYCYTQEISVMFWRTNGAQVKKNDIIKGHLYKRQKISIERPLLLKKEIMYDNSNAMLK